jgi:hypothetical protein
MNTSVRRGMGLAALLTVFVVSPALAQGTIAQWNWTLLSADSEDLEGGYYPAVNAFDGDPTTMWVTQWYSASPSPPHEILIDLGAQYNVNGFRYLPRQDGVSAGNIAQYAFYVSTDGSSWGSPVAQGSFANVASEQQVSFAPRTGQYIRLRALSEVGGGPWAAVAELNVSATDAPPSGGGGGGSEGLSGNAIPQSGWSLQAVDSQETATGNFRATSAFDGNRSTMWATQWLASSPPPPHGIQIDLGGTYDITGFRYLPRQDGLSQGNIGQYQFFVSADGLNWGSAVASGSFANSSAEQQVNFSGRSGRYIRLVALSESSGQAWTTVAELNVLTSSAVPPGGGPPPSNSTVRAVFAPSADHNSLVQHYVLDIFPAGVDVTAANPVASVDLGKPAIVNGECQSDITSFINSLWSGTFVATVTAVGNQGSGQSAASPPFSR